MSKDAMQLPRDSIDDIIRSQGDKGVSTKTGTLYDKQGNVLAEYWRLPKKLMDGYENNHELMEKLRLSRYVILFPRPVLADEYIQNGNDLRKSMLPYEKAQYDRKINDVMIVDKDAPISLELAAAVVGHFEEADKNRLMGLDVMYHDEQHRVEMIGPNRTQSTDYSNHYTEYLQYMLSACGIESNVINGINGDGIRRLDIALDEPMPTVSISKLKKIFERARGGMGKMIEKLKVTKVKTMENTNDYNSPEM